MEKGEDGGTDEHVLEGEAVVVVVVVGACIVVVPSDRLKEWWADDLSP